MSKRSRDYFESFKEFEKLCQRQNVCAPPKQKRRKLNPTNNNNTVQNEIQESTISQCLSPSPPSILSLKKKAKNTTTKSDIETQTVIEIMKNISLKPPSPNHYKYRNKNLYNSLSKPLIDKNKLFDGYTFYITNVNIKNKQNGVYKHWSDLNKNRVKLLNNIIPKKGGQIIENIHDFDCDEKNENNSLIIIVSQQIKRQDFEQLFTKNMPENNNKFIFITPEFITCCLKYENKLPLKQFEPKCLSQKQHKKQTANIKKQDIFLLDTTQVTQHKKRKINYNSNITEIFDEMESIYGCLGDKWRAFAYKKANGFIKIYPKKIETENDIKQLIKMKGFSKKLGDKVFEIINSGKLRKLNELKVMPQIKIIKLFTNIFGVGSITAQKWYNLGLKTLNDIKNAYKLKKIKLQQRQIIGLQYYDDLLIKICRLEIDEIKRFINNEININICVGCISVVCGSYRRGALQSGDIDILITHSNAKKTNGLLMKIVKRLHEIGFLVDDLSLSSADSYMGICKLLDNKYKYYRHIDIKVYKPDFFAFAVLYFTGSDHFNRSIRYYAKKKGYTLSDIQLAPSVRINNNKTFIFAQKAIKCETEEDIFKTLGLKYIKPIHRNGYENFGQSL